MKVLLFFFPQSSSDFSPSVPRLTCGVGEDCRSLHCIAYLIPLFPLKKKARISPAFHQGTISSRMQLQAPEHLSVTCYPWPNQCLHLHPVASTGRDAGVRTDINMVWGAFLVLWNICISTPALWGNELSMVSASDLWFEVMFLMTFLALVLLQSPARSPTPAVARAHSFCSPLAAPWSIWHMRWNVVERDPQMDRWQLNQIIWLIFHQIKWWVRVMK